MRISEGKGRLLSAAMALLMALNMVLNLAPVKTGIAAGDYSVAQSEGGHVEHSLDGDTVRLTARANSGYKFVGWQPASIGKGGNSASFKLGEVASARAVFEKEKPVEQKPEQAANTEQKQEAAQPVAEEEKQELAKPAEVEQQAEVPQPNAADQQKPVEPEAPEQKPDTAGQAPEQETISKPELEQQADSQDEAQQQNAAQQAGQAPEKDDESTKPENGLDEAAINPAWAQKLEQLGEQPVDIDSNVSQQASGESQQDNDANSSQGGSVAQDGKPDGEKQDGTDSQSGAETQGSDEDKGQAGGEMPAINPSWKQKLDQMQPLEGDETQEDGEQAAEPGADDQAQDAAVQPTQPGQETSNDNIEADGTNEEQGDGNSDTSVDGLETDTGDGVDKPLPASGARMPTIKPDWAKKLEDLAQNSGNIDTEAPAEMADEQLYEGELSEGLPFIEDSLESLMDDGDQLDGSIQLRQGDAAVSAIGFGELAQGYTQPEWATVAVFNDGGSALTGLGVDMSRAGGYELGGSMASGVQPGNMAAFTIRPRAGLLPGDYSQSVTVSGTDAQGNAVTRQLSLSFAVEGKSKVGPSFALLADGGSASALGFGEVALGSRPDARSVSIQNDGSETLTIQASLSGDAFDLKLDATTLTPGQTATASIRPRAGLTAGAHSARLLVNASYGNGVKLAVKGVDISIDVAASGDGLRISDANGSVVSSLAMNMSLGGNASAGANVTNLTGRPLRNLSYTMSGTGRSAFVVQLGSGDLAAGASRTLGIQSAQGLHEATYSARLTISGTDPSGNEISARLALTLAVKEDKADYEIQLLDGGTNAPLGRVDFQERYGYYKAQRKSIVIKNAGSNGLTNLRVSQSNLDRFTLVSIIRPEAVLAPGDGISFMLLGNMDLRPGVYSTTVTVSATGVGSTQALSRTLDVRFVVLNSDGSQPSGGITQTPTPSTPAQPTPSQSTSVQPTPAKPTPPSANPKDPAPTQSSATPPTSTAKPQPTETQQTQQQPGPTPKPLPPVPTQPGNGGQNNGQNQNVNNNANTNQNSQNVNVNNVVNIKPVVKPVTRQSVVYKRNAGYTGSMFYYRLPQTADMSDTMRYVMMAVFALTFMAGVVLFNRTRKTEKVILLALPAPALGDPCDTE